MKIKKLNKNGQVLDKLGSLGVGIATLAILLVIAFLIQAEGKDQALDLISADTFTNETQTSVTFEVFTGFDKCVPDLALSISEIYSNDNDTTLLGNDNATVVLNTVNFSNKTGFFESSTFNFSYSCKQADAAVNATDTLQNATSDIPGWVPLVVVAVIGGLLLGLIQLFRRNQ